MALEIDLEKQNNFMAKLEKFEQLHGCKLCECGYEGQMGVVGEQLSSPAYIICLIFALIGVFIILYNVINWGTAAGICIVIFSLYQKEKSFILPQM